MNNKKKVYDAIRKLGGEASIKQIVETTMMSNWQLWSAINNLKVSGHLEVIHSYRLTGRNYRNVNQEFIDFFEDNPNKEYTTREVLEICDPTSTVNLCGMRLKRLSKMKIINQRREANKSYWSLNNVYGAMLESMEK